ncbi:LLM class flavin-dependent oxidoreductase [Alkalibacterium sp. 20]|uniref:LLM class flavin-dependent oxidoreductase n=1 Tax=Alkalibacterium sp. 20 TaxID=1798803 RepID=UPI000900343F|nr:LLM class flavin-dependent oxidoreductase [Alkalibacterium sp. 20]OJF94575.1 luciferase [Alkalibacterium sp. 20]
MRLSVLDQAPITSGNTGQVALEKAVELAQYTEGLGYYRMWLAEHHGSSSFASSAPEVVVAYIAAKTKHIRLGTGGTMMMHYSPLKMAEVFKTLSALAPGRIDYGVGRAPGGDQNAIYALAQGNDPDFDHLYEKLDVALALIKDDVPDETLYSKTPATPQNVTLPEAWLLGSSGNSAIEAGQRGLGYSFAQFFMLNAMRKEIFDLYRDRFVPSAFMEKPEISVAYLVTVAETKEEAEFQAKPQDIARIRLGQGRMSPLMSPEEAQKHKLTDDEREAIQTNRQIHLVGTAKEVAELLYKDQKTYGFQEAMICSIAYSQEQRLNTYKLLAEEML